MLFAARLPGRPSDFREEKSTHMTRGKKNSVGDLNACMSVLALQWKDTHVVNIIELFLYFNRLGYKQFVRKRESFCEKCFCAYVCVTGLPLLGKITISLSGRPALFDRRSRGKTTEGELGISVRAGESESDRAKERQRILTREGHERKSPCLTTPVTFNLSAKQKKSNEREKERKSHSLSIDTGL